MAFNRAHKMILWTLLVLTAFTAHAQSGAERVRSLVDTLEHDPDFKVRIAAAQALSKLADGTVADWMIRAFRKDNNDAVRLTILDSISRIPDVRILSPLIEVANQEILSSKERMLIEQIVWNYREIIHAPSWIAMAMQNGDNDMKKIAVWVLGNICDQNMIPIFEKVLENAPEDVQIQIYQALSKTGSPRALEICKEAEQNEPARSVLPAIRFCQSMTSLIIQKKIKLETTTHKKLNVDLQEIAKRSYKPNNFLTYLQKNLNKRQIEVAMTFLQPLSGKSSTDKSVKLIERETMLTFQLVVDMNSKYEFDTKDLEVLKSIIRENSNSIDQCYMKEFAKDNKLKGDVKTQFKIKKTGEIQNTEIVLSTLKNELVENCVLAELKNFEFPALPIDHVNMIYTFTFTPPRQAQIQYRY